MTTAPINPNVSLVIVLGTMVEYSESIRFKFGSDDIYNLIDKEAIQTILDKL